jgi:hypothetical protein
MQVHPAVKHTMMGRGKKRKMEWKERRLEDLISVGPAIRGQFALLGINTVAELAQCDPEVLYRQLCRKTRKRQDVCVLDVYCAAVEQARNPGLHPEQCVWWYWSRLRKASAKAG